MHSYARRPRFRRKSNDSSSSPESGMSDRPAVLVLPPLARRGARPRPLVPLTARPEAWLLTLDIDWKPELAVASFSPPPSLSSLMSRSFDISSSLEKAEGVVDLAKDNVDCLFVPRVRPPRPLVEGALVFGVGSYTKR